MLPAIGADSSFDGLANIAINAVLNDLALRPAMTVCFNNHARAKAVRNAFQLMDMLSIDHK
ncbi:MAG: hypothetical protein WBL92_04115 [Methanothrix sp.]